MQAHEKLRLLLAMAAADGRVTVEELRLLSHRAISLGVTDNQFQALLDDAIGGTGDIQLPERPQARLDLLVELIRMMAADGKLHSSEKHLFACVAAQMKVSDQSLTDAIDRALEADRA